MITWKIDGKWLQAWLSGELMGEYRPSTAGKYHVRLYVPAKRIMSFTTAGEAIDAIRDHVHAFADRAMSAGFVRPIHAPKTTWRFNLRDGRSYAASGETFEQARINCACLHVDGRIHLLGSAVLIT